jgi:MFS family permease
MAGFFLGINFWAPVEKLFLNKIGFIAASIGLLAATYAVVVPFLEIPSGILADRWSRRGVLMIADLALAASAVLGGIAVRSSSGSETNASFSAPPAMCFRLLAFPYGRCTIPSVSAPASSQCLGERNLGDASYRYRSTFDGGKSGHEPHSTLCLL